MFLPWAELSVLMRENIEGSPASNKLNLVLDIENKSSGLRVLATSSSLVIDYRHLPVSVAV